MSSVHVLEAYATLISTFYYYYTSVLIHCYKRFSNMETELTLAQ